MAKKFEVTSKGGPNAPMIISMIGYLNASTALDDFRNFLESLLEKNKGERLIIDMTNLYNISGTGLEMIVEILDGLKRVNGDVSIFGMSPKIKNLFEALGYAGMISIFATEEEAIECRAGLSEKDDY